MRLLKNLRKNSLVENTKGGKYYETTYSANLDVFSGISRFNDTNEIIKKFKKAICEDEIVALANLLYILDIRGGKGERLLFKTIFSYLCKNEKEMALKILPHIASLGRWDYILEGIDTTIDEEVVSLIRNQLDKDKLSSNPSLLAKWLPTHKTHNKRNEMASKLIKKLKITEKEYRKTLTNLRKQLNLIENNLTKKEYDIIKFEAVPTKAMLKYKKAFRRNCESEYQKYLEKAKKHEVKINTTGLYSYEIIRNIALDINIDEDLYDVMWNNQKDILKRKYK